MNTQPILFLSIAISFWCFAILPTTALQAQTSDREADLFGEAPPAAAIDDRDDELFGRSNDSETLQELDQEELAPEFFQNTSDDNIIQESLDQQDDTLDIGGTLYMRMQYDMYEHGRIEDFTLSSPNLLDLYIDGRPNNRVRAYARGRLTYDFTIPENSVDMFGQTQEALQVALDQLWLKFDIAYTVYITLGRQAIRWGSNRFWNPTDFLNNQTKDPLALFDERLGVNLVKAHIPIESLGWNIYALANLGEANTSEDIGGALRLEMLFAQTELALSAAARNQMPLQLGFDVSTALWLFDFHAEVASKYNDTRNFWRGEFDMVRGIIPTSYTRENEWLIQTTIGAEITIRYSDQDNIILGAEYYFNDLGYDDPNLYTWLAMENQLTFFNLGKHYASFYALLMQPGNWNDTMFILSLISNISDQTGVARFDCQVRVLTHLDVSFYTMAYLGKHGEFNYSVNIEPNAAIPELENGITIEPARIQIGLWLTLAI